MESLVSLASPGLGALAGFLAALAGALGAVFGAALALGVLAPILGRDSASRWWPALGALLVEGLAIEVRTRGGGDADPLALGLGVSLAGLDLGRPGCGLLNGGF